jgi:hypothetical protein
MIITSLYEMTKPDPKFVKLHEKKVAAVIAEMGDKYLLSKRMSKPIEKAESNGKH